MTAVATLAHGQPEYAALLDRIRADERDVSRAEAVRELVAAGHRAVRASR